MGASISKPDRYLCPSATCASHISSQGDVERAMQRSMAAANCCCATARDGAKLSVSGESIATVESTLTSDDWSGSELDLAAARRASGSLNNLRDGSTQLCINATQTSNKCSTCGGHKSLPFDGVSPLVGRIVKRVTHRRAKSTSGGGGEGGLMYQGNIAQHDNHTTELCSKSAGSCCPNSNEAYLNGMNQFNATCCNDAGLSRETIDGDCGRLQLPAARQAAAASSHLSPLPFESALRELYTCCDHKLVGCSARSGEAIRHDDKPRQQQQQRLLHQKQKLCLLKGSSANKQTKFSSYLEPPKNRPSNKETNQFNDLTADEQPLRNQRACVQVASLSPVTASTSHLQPRIGEPIKSSLTLPHVATKFDTNLLDIHLVDGQPQPQQQQSTIDIQQQQQTPERSPKNHMAWQDLARQYGRAPAQTRARASICDKLRGSCLFHVIFSTFLGLFPIFGSFRGYSLPADIITDLTAGFTIAVLHIPQGMAYGMLAGVEPIYGLYVSFVPVLVMAFMSKSSRHVSYGTFAVVSMLLANAKDSVKQAIRVHMASKIPIEPLVGAQPTSDTSNLLITNNHQPIDESQQILRSLIGSAPVIDTPYSAPALNSSSILATLLQETPESFKMPSDIEILTCICIVVGLIQVCMSLLRLGVLSLMLSDQLVSSFTTASAVHVVTSQIPGLFDITLGPITEGPFKICRTWWTVAAKLYEDLNYCTAILSIVSILALLSVKEILEPRLRRKFKSLTCLPSELVLMAAVILLSWWWQFESDYQVRVVGQVPTGLPIPHMPKFELASFVFQDAFTIALVSFAMNLSLAQVYAKKYKYTMDPNQELFALGTSNVVGSYFNCFPCASSLSRSAILSNLNAKSQLSSLFSCAIVISVICYFAPILYDLPRSTLSCITVVALKGILVQVTDLYENWRLSKLDALVWIITFTSVIVFGVTYGLVLGILASLFMVFIRLLTPNHSILGKLSGTDLYVDRSAFMNCNEVDGIRIFRFNSALCYLNRTKFKACIEESLPDVFSNRGGLFSCPEKLGPFSAQKSGNKIKFLVIDCSALAYCDYAGATMIVELVEELDERKIKVCLAGCPLKLIRMIEKMRRTDLLDRHAFPSILDAVNHAQTPARAREPAPQSSSKLDESIVVTTK